MEGLELARAAKGMAKKPVLAWSLSGRTPCGGVGWAAGGDGDQSPYRQAIRRVEQPVDPGWQG